MEHQWKALGRMGTTNDRLNPKIWFKSFWMMSTMENTTSKSMCGVVKMDNVNL
jgi:hypothetical protein